MKKLSTKGALLFASAIAVCAFALPAMASAATWHGPFPSTHLLDAPGTNNPNNRLSITRDAAPPSGGWVCGFAQFHLDILSPTDARVTNFVTNGCHGTGLFINCTVTLKAGNLPWTVTNPSTHDIEIHDIDITEQYENTPGSASACAAPVTITTTGTLRNGTWTNPGHELEFNNAPGLITHPAGADGFSGTFVDTSGNLLMTD
jgi:hypothetical protein